LADADGHAVPSSLFPWRARRPFEELDELADGVAPVERMPQRELVVDVVLVASADPRPGQVTGLDKVVDDHCCRAFGDADGRSDVAKPHRRFAGDALQDVCVVGQEPPGMIPNT
jgi:hypothetical protein